MGMSTPINLNNAGLFSALAYAPNGNSNADSMAWALTQPGATIYQDARIYRNLRDSGGTVIVYLCEHGQTRRMCKLHYWLTNRVT